jgi:hypothetical protein
VVVAQLTQPITHAGAGGNFGPRVSGPIRVLIWLGIRIAQVAIYFVLGWIVTAVTGEQFLRNYFTTLVGIGVFFALPATVLVSAIAWFVPSIAATVRHVAHGPRWAVVVATGMEFVATLFFFLAWLPNDWPVVLICVVLSAALASALPLSYRVQARTTGHAPYM